MKTALGNWNETKYTHESYEQIVNKQQMTKKRGSGGQFSKLPVHFNIYRIKKHFVRSFLHFLSFRRDVAVGTDQR